MKIAKKILAGNQFTKSRFHDQKGNLVDLEGLLYFPHSLLTTLIRLIGGGLPDFPWLGYGAIRYLDRVLEPEWRVLEFGSGMSTMWFAKRCHKVVSIEDTEKWYTKVEKTLQAHGITNVDYELKSQSAYSVLDEYEDRHFDFILIDGSQRAMCAASAVSKVKEGGYIYLDNSDKHYGPSGRDVYFAEETLLKAAEMKGGQVKYFVDFIPAYVAVTQGMIVRL